MIIHNVVCEASQQLMKLALKENAPLDNDHVSLIITFLLYYILKLINIPLPGRKNLKVTSLKLNFYHNMQFLQVLEDAFIPLQSPPSQKKTLKSKGTKIQPARNDITCPNKDFFCYYKKPKGKKIKSK